MKHILWLLSVLLVTCVFAQEDATLGTLRGSTYTNRSFGFRFEIPSGWKAVSTDDDAFGLGADDERYLALQRTSDPQTLIIFKGVKFEGTPTISADRSRSYADTVSDRGHASVTRDPVRVVIGGVDMFRTDLQEPDAPQPFITLLTVAIRDRIRVFEIRGTAQRELDPAVLMLALNSHFDPDYEVPGAKVANTLPLTIEAAAIRNAVEDSALHPVYPAEAKTAGISGSITFNFEISEKGVPIRIWLVEVSENLAEPTKEAGTFQRAFEASALEEVKKLRFRPHKQNGKAVPSYAHYTVNFSIESTKSNGL